MGRGQAQQAPLLLLLLKEEALPPGKRIQVDLTWVQNLEADGAWDKPLSQRGALLPEPATAPSGTAPGQAACPRQVRVYPKAPLGPPEFSHENSPPLQGSALPRPIFPRKAGGAEETRTSPRIRGGGWTSSARSTTPPWLSVESSKDTRRHRKASGTVYPTR